MGSQVNMTIITTRSKRAFTPTMLNAMFSTLFSIPLGIPILIGLTATAHASNTHYTNEPINQKSALTNYVKSNDGCYVYQPKASLGNNVKWNGRCVNGYAEGQGIAEWYNNAQRTSRYQGNFIHGKLQGKGRINWDITNNNHYQKNADCFFDYYEGEIKDSEFFGHGVLHYTNGNIFDGEFVPTGQTATGVYIWGKGSPYYSDRYEGDFLDGARHGRGIYTWGEHSPWAGDRYEGDFYQNQFHGHGTYYDEYGYYEGEWRHNKRQGVGAYIGKDGSRYEGDWRDNVKAGYGEMTFTDGSTYKGQWNNSFDPSYGIRTWPNGARYEGEALEGAPHGYGKLTYPDGAIYEGNFVYGLREGKGKITDPSGAWIEVEFRDDEPYGKGVDVRSNGIRYEGQFRGYDAWGYGHLTVPRAAFDDDKRAKNGVWQGDTFVEKGWFYENKFKFPCDSYEHCIQVAASNPEYQQYMD